MEFIEFDFSYVDKHIDMIIKKTINKTKLSLFNGFINKIYIIEKKDDNIFFYQSINNNLIKIDYEKLIEEIMMIYKSSMGKITFLYRIFTDSINTKTNNCFRELWGDMLYIDPKTYKFKSENIDANNLANIVKNIKFSENEEKIFGKLEEYVFRDNNENIIMGYDYL